MLILHDSKKIFNFPFLRQFCNNTNIKIKRICPTIPTTTNAFDWSRVIRYNRDMDCTKATNFCQKIASILRLVFVVILKQCTIKKFLWDFHLKCLFLFHFQKKDVYM